MFLKSISLLNYRNYAELHVELPEEGALFYGVNGSGKTNLLESIAFVLLGKSPRGVGAKELILHGEREAFVQATLYTSDRVSAQSIGFSRDKQLIVTRNGERASSLRSLYGENRFVWFGPDDIQLVIGSPEEKRRFIDITLSQYSGAYLAELLRFRKILRERNALLVGRFDPLLCDLFDHDLAQSMMAITAQRRHFFDAISTRTTEYYDLVSGNDAVVTVEYAPSINCDSVEGFEEELRRRRLRDREQGFTSAGIHRDTMRCRKGGRSIVGFGSQGQCRSAALALKAASMEYLSHENHSLILAIDDAFSDLDAKRRSIFFDLIRTRGQIFMAVHSREEIDYYSLPVYKIGEGKVEQL